MAEDSERKRLDLVRNKRLKLAATYLNGVALAIFAVGGLAPATAAIISASTGTRSAALVMLAVCVATSVALHYVASSLLKGLRG